VERFELPSTVLETAILPLNYTRRHEKASRETGTPFTFFFW
jgi:hypothetical protein